MVRCTTRPWSRRDFLRLTLLGGAGTLAACASRTLSPADSPTPLPGPTHFAASPPAPGPTASHTLPLFPSARPSLTPSPAELIQHVVIFIQENHTFDSLFAGFPGANGVAGERACPDALPGDPPHQHADALAPGGFTMGASNCSYDESTAPVYWQLARAFTLCDSYYSDMRGPSHPNYFMLVAAQSPIVDTPFPEDACPRFCLDLPTIADRLDSHGLTWRDYGGLYTGVKSKWDRSEVFDSSDEEFFSDAAGGTLPNVSWLNSGFLSDGDNKSGHPPGSLCRAQNYAANVLNALMSGPQWTSLAAILIWDDWGGFYDHVEPPAVETWRDGTPVRYGHRVPCLVISPYARQGFVSHTFYSHVSTLRLVETLFELEPLNERDAAANDMLECFDVAQAPIAPFRLTPPECL